MILRNSIRAIAVFLLTVYIPLTAFASGSYIWCVADFGHSAVKFTDIAGGHNKITLTDHEAEQLSNFLYVHHPVDCFDRPISVSTPNVSQLVKQISSPSRDKPEAISQNVSIQLWWFYSNDNLLKTKTAYLFPSLLHLKTLILLH